MAAGVGWDGRPDAQPLLSPDTASGTDCLGYALCEDTQLTFWGKTRVWPQRSEGSAVFCFGHRKRLKSWKHLGERKVVFWQWVIHFLFCFPSELAPMNFSALIWICVLDAVLSKHTLPCGWTANKCFLGGGVSWGWHPSWVAGHCSPSLAPAQPRPLTQCAGLCWKQPGLVNQCANERIVYSRGHSQLFDTTQEPFSIWGQPSS